MPRPIISLLTDFGTRDAFVGICKGVILGIAPDAQIIDLTHEGAAFRIRDGAVWLRAALPSLPVGVHLGIVDPGVGTARRAIAVEVARGDRLVGPDNGLLLPAAERLGGIVAVHELANPRYRLASVSGTFHGRDVFSPAAAHLAVGVAVAELGPAIPPADLVRMEIPAPHVAPGELRTIALYVDTFGSVETGATRGELEAALGPLEAGDILRVAGAKLDLAIPWVHTFGDVAAGDPLVYENSYGLVGVAINRGSAAERFGLSEDDEIAITRG